MIRYLTFDDMLEKENGKGKSCSEPVRGYSVTFYSSLTLDVIYSLHTRNTSLVYILFSHTQKKTTLFSTKPQPVS